MNIDTSHQSPNHSSRAGQAIDLLLLHATVGSLAPSIAWLCNPASEVSSHYVIAKTGAIYQLVDESQAAWHAGVAVWQGHTNINERSLGIELENDNTGRDPYPPAQVQALINLTRDIQTRHPAISFARHLDVARPIGRKTDPAGFGWEGYVAAVTTPQPPPPPLPITRYRVTADMFWLEDRRPDAPIANQGRALLQIGDVVAINDVTGGWAHAANGTGFTLLAGLEAL